MHFNDNQVFLKQNIGTVEMKMKIVLSNFNYSTIVHGTKMKNRHY